ncbi:MAG: tetratricopeptide repeat protein [Candidatus Melainabacteria bacterium]|nr:tetratricopeptide repeat protein [Candidatus Melainabacteria bacterium]
MTESWETLTNMAESAARGGRYAEAKDSYRRALADADSRRDPSNAYYTRCNLAGLLRLLDEYTEAEQLLKEATHLRHTHPEHLAREPISPLTDLERILVKQNRLAELEILLSSDVEKMFAVYGRESFECKMSLMNLAKVYGTHFKDMEKCKAIFAEVLEWAKTQAEPITRKMIYLNYDGVLRGAGLIAEADAAQAELAALPKPAAT